MLHFEQALLLLPYCQGHLAPFLLIQSSQHVAIPQGVLLYLGHLKD